MIETGERAIIIFWLNKSIETHKDGSFLLYVINVRGKQLLIGNTAAHEHVLTPSRLALSVFPKISTTTLARVDY